MSPVRTATLTFAFCEAPAPVLRLSDCMPAKFWNALPLTDRRLSAPPVSPPEEDDPFTTLVTSLQDRVAELRADLERERVKAEADIGREREKAEQEIARERTERQQERDRADKSATELAELAKALAQALEGGAARERELLEKLTEAERAGRRWWPWRRAG